MLNVCFRVSAGKSSTKYAQIDITATETAHKVGTQHALGRQEGLHALDLRRKGTPHWGLQQRSISAGCLERCATAKCAGTNSEKVLFFSRDCFQEEPHQLVLTKPGPPCQASLYNGLERTIWGNLWWRIGEKEKEMSQILRSNSSWSCNQGSYGHGKPGKVMEF